MSESPAGPPDETAVKEIVFKDIDVSSHGVVSATVVRDKAAALSIELPYSFILEPDLLAIAFATLAGKAYEVIRIDLPLSTACQSMLGKWTQSCVISRNAPGRRRRPGKNYALNFSGGFDSLAARAVMPDSELVSLDFGGRFSREEKFFRRFNPYKLTTNLVDLGLNKNHWSFMAIGSILLRDELDIGTYAFGEVMAGSARRLAHEGTSQAGTALPLGEYLGMSVLKPVAGISEIGALIIAVRKYGRLIPQILESVALPDEDKYLRKFLMLKAVLQQEGLEYSLPEPTSMRSRLEWGKYYATDLASLYVAKVLGPATASSSYNDGIPDDILERVEGMSLDFFCKINPHAYAGVTDVDRRRVYMNLVDCGFDPYSQRDWKELQDITQLLAR